MGYKLVLIKYFTGFVSVIFILGQIAHGQDGNFSTPPPGFNQPAPLTPQPSSQQKNPLINTSESTDIITANEAGQESVVPTGVAVSDNYVIKGSDIVSVTVINEPELSVRGNRVTSQGMILMPLLGEVKIMGYTLQQAREHITRLYRADYLVNPQVVVTLESTDQNEFIMRGQVGGVGVNKIPTDGQMTLLKAIYSRGGPTKIANIKRIRITRRVNNQSTTSEYDLRRIQKGEIPDPEILPGDIIEVPENFF